MKRLNTLWTSAVVALLVASPLTAGAQLIGNTPPGPGQPVVRDFQGILVILERALSWIYTLFFLIATIMILWAAFGYLTAGGDEEKVEKSKTSIKFAIYAMVIAILATSVSFVVKNFFNAQ